MCSALCGYTWNLQVHFGSLIPGLFCLMALVSDGLLPDLLVQSSSFSSKGPFYWVSVLPGQCRIKLQLFKFAGLLPGLLFTRQISLPVQTAVWGKRFCRQLYSGVYPVLVLCYPRTCSKSTFVKDRKMLMLQTLFSLVQALCRLRCLSMHA